jgi:hypothetical protein
MLRRTIIFGLFFPAVLLVSSTLVLAAAEDFEGLIYPSASGQGK